LSLRFSLSSLAHQQFCINQGTQTHSFPLLALCSVYFICSLLQYPSKNKCAQISFNFHNHSPSFSFLVQNRLLLKNATILCSCKQFAIVRPSPFPTRHLVTHFVDFDFGTVAGEDKKGMGHCELN
jgi:hypothetical protein